MADDQGPEPTERTPQDYEVRVPARQEFFGNLRKAAQPEYRVWITLPGMPIADESVWLPVIQHLEREEPGAGPVADWEDESTMRVVLTVNADSDGDAAAVARGIAVAALRAVGRDPDVGAMQTEPLPAAAKS